MQLVDSRTGPVGPALLLLECLHQGWGFLLHSLSSEQFARQLFHPEMKEFRSLDEILGLYAWHGHYHIGQIRWLRTHRLNLPG